mgnify:CR=1 FL=1
MTATSLFTRAAGARTGSNRQDDRPVRSVDSTELFAGRSEIEIVHQGNVYRLKITKQGKLILNK